MKFVSTRGRCAPVDFEGALMHGYAPDGGMFMPETIPSLPWRDWAELTYPQLVAKICAEFVDADCSIDALCQEVYDKVNWSHSEIAPLHKIDDGLNVLELFHGPTWAFKDYSLMLVVKLMQYYLDKRQKYRTVLVGTSGDTGSSAMAAVTGCSNIDLLVLLPDNRCNAIQQRQMTVVDQPNVHCYAVDGNSDEIDESLRPIFADHKLVEEHSIGSVNSVNWCRIMVQTAHWLYAYFKLRQNNVDPVVFAVPTGAAGNVTAGIFLAQMGVPLRFVLCVGPNDIMHRWLKTGLLQSSTLQQSLAPAIDIQQPYNVERIIWMVSGYDTQLTDGLMQSFYSTGKCQVDQTIMQKVRESVIDTVSVSNDEMRDTIVKLVVQSGYRVCPHTATALHYAHANPKCRPLTCIATASPDKCFDVYEQLQDRLGKIEKSEKLRKLMATPVKQPYVLARSSMSTWTSTIIQHCTRITQSRNATS